MTRITSCLAVICLLVCSSCAHVDVKKLKPNDETTEGVRFFRPWPYFLVTVLPGTPKPDAKPGDPPPKPSFQTAVIWLPDMSQEYVVDVVEGWGTANGSVELSNGWMLSKFGGAVDSKGPETIAAVGGLITALAGSGILKSDDIEKVLDPGLYRILFDNKGHVSGVQQVTLPLVTTKAVPPAPTR